MSKKTGLDRLNKWDKNFNNWESSEYYYSQEDQEDLSEEKNKEKEKRHESRKY